MFRDKNILAVVPARSGSKGIPDKNLRTVGDVPLVRRAAECIQSCDLIDCSLISTDSKKIAEISGLPQIFERPEEISGDHASAGEVLTHALTSAEKFYQTQFDIVLYLEPTSPLRQAKHLEACLQKLEEEKLDAVWTVSPVDPSFHPMKLLKVGDSGVGFYHPQGAEIVARQQLDTLYRRNGICYALTRETALKGMFMGENTGAIVCESFYISIDNPEDLALANYIHENQQIFKTPDNEK